MDTRKIQQKFIEQFSEFRQFKNCSKRYVVNNDATTYALEVDTNSILGNEYFFRGFSESLFCLEASSDWLHVMYIKYDELKRQNLIVAYSGKFGGQRYNLLYQVGVLVWIKEDRYEIEIRNADDTASLTDEESISKAEYFFALATGICSLLQNKTVVNRSVRSFTKAGGGKLKLSTDTDYIGIKVPRIEASYTPASTASDSETNAEDRPAWAVRGAWHTFRSKEGEAECVHSWIPEEGSDRRERCEHCDQLRWFVRPHLRDNPELGMMTKTRYVYT